MAGTILVVGSMIIASSLALGLAATGQAAVVARRAAGAADNAAIAAADTVSGALPGDPCARAAEVAAASGARLAACETRDLDAWVLVEATFIGLVATARARAGPPASMTRTAAAARRADSAHSGRCVWCASEKGPPWPPARNSSSSNLRRR